MPEENPFCSLVNLLNQCFWFVNWLEARLLLDWSPFPRHSCSTLKLDLQAQCCKVLFMNSLPTLRGRRIVTKTVTQRFLDQLCISRNITYRKAQNFSSYGVFLTENDDNRLWNVFSKQCIYAWVCVSVFTVKYTHNVSSSGLSLPHWLIVKDPWESKGILSQAVFFFPIMPDLLCLLIPFLRITEQFLLCL